VVSGHCSHKVNAFIDFSDITYSKAVMDHFPSRKKGEGSAITLENGDECNIEYARPLNQKYTQGKMPKSDWTCDQCGTYNFSKRLRCFQCGIDREFGTKMQLYGGEIIDTIDDEIGKFDSNTPTSSLVIYNLSTFSGENELAAALRPYAPIKEVEILRDSSGRTRRIGFVSFVSVEAATHTLKAAQTAGLELDGSQLHFAYSAGPAVAQVLTQANLRRQQIRKHLLDQAAPYLNITNQKSTTETIHRDWPPVFEKGATDYHFDAASGYFYEPISGFYYDPKQKFYFNAQTRDYFHHTPNTNPPFTKFDYLSSTTISSNTPAKNAPLTSHTKKEEDLITPKQESEKKINIHHSAQHIKKTGPIAFGLLKTSATINPKQTLSIHQSPHTTSPKLALSQVLAVGTNYDQLHRLYINNRPAVAFCEANNKWLCLVSERQFSSEDKLKSHIAKSQLYKDALQRAVQNNLITLQ